MQHGHRRLAALDQGRVGVLQCQNTMKPPPRTIQLVLLCGPDRKDCARAVGRDQHADWPSRRALLVLGSQENSRQAHQFIRESIERLAGGSVVGADLLSEQILGGSCRAKENEPVHTTWTLAHLDDSPPADPYAPHAPRLTLLHNKLPHGHTQSARIRDRIRLGSKLGGKSIRRRQSTGTHNLRAMNACCRMEAGDDIMSCGRHT